ncbi:hypothetical protein NDU88_007675 [Pleurodeles waltl]|uniref:Uncharacterized protein n=1 Tax=Pleurodeles waltl TaxID=8319 RepID=A0AAV7QLC6_PLEWA|nr:hypothetical protein NDU88_007675 [Pleurodeles waltl]
MEKGHGQALTEGITGSRVLDGGADWEQEEIVFDAALPMPFKERVGDQGCVPVQEKSNRRENPEPGMMIRDLRRRDESTGPAIPSGGCLQDAAPSDAPAGEGLSLYVTSYYFGM